MHSDIAIQVENVGKRYRIHHEQQRTGRRYVALRDVIAETLKGWLPRSKHSGSQRTSEDFWALKNVSFEIKKGEAVGVIGRNGAGKSTLLKVLSRITEPTKGNIGINGRVASLLEVGTGFHPELTGRENIYLNGAILGMRRVEIRSKFDEIVAFAEVEQFIDTPVKRYSSGMYMRLAFAVAAHLEPEILIVDEVLAVGDAAFQQKCLGKMQDVGGSGRTVIFVSHNTEALARLCTSCIYLKEGQLQMAGPTREVIREYADNFKQVAGEIDLTKARRRMESSGAASFTAVRSLQEAATSAYWCYDYGSPLSFLAEFTVLKTIDEPEIGYAIFSMGGIELVSTTTHQESGLGRLAPGCYQIRISIPDLLLNPGKYVFGIGLSTQGRNVDNIGEAVQIEILPNESSTRKGLYKIWAPLTPKTQFELTTLNAITNSTPSVAL